MKPLDLDCTWEQSLFKFDVIHGDDEWFDTEWQRQLLRLFVDLICEWDGFHTSGVIVPLDFFNYFDDLVVRG